MFFYFYFRKKMGMRTFEILVVPVLIVSYTNVYVFYEVKIPSKVYVYLIGPD